MSKYTTNFDYLWSVLPSRAKAKIKYGTVVTVQLLHKLIEEDKMENELQVKRVQCMTDIAKLQVNLDKIDKEIKDSQGFQAGKKYVYEGDRRLKFVVFRRDKELRRAFYETFDPWDMKRDWPLPGPTTRPYYEEIND